MEYKIKPTDEVYEPYCDVIEYNDQTCDVMMYMLWVQRDLM